MKVLITGGAGNIGISLVENLIKADIEVAIFDLEEQIEINKNRINSQTELNAGSILNESDISNAIKNCTHVVHLAAALGVSNTEANKKKLP